MTDTPDELSEDLLSTQAIFKLATIAEQRGAPLSFFQQLGSFYNELYEGNDYDLDIGIYRPDGDPPVPPEPEQFQVMSQGMPVFTIMHGGNGLEEAQVDEAVEETYFRLIIESAYFDAMIPDERELFLIGLMQEMLTWLGDRHQF